MAEFSKQYCEIYDEDFPWDFDIEAEAETIPKGHYKPMICEGFGFLGIGVDLNGNIEILLTNPKDETKSPGFIDLDSIIRETATPYTVKG